MSKDMQCPYCESWQEVCHDDGDAYGEGVNHEHTCRECDKTFTFQTSISFYYKPRKADCLNGSDHNLIFRLVHPIRYSRMVCSDCEYSRIATDDEIKMRGATP